jgi:Carboxypeptidase regulatory-like domain
MSKRIIFAVIACVVVLCCGQRTFAQATGAFQGTVTDKSGSAIAGASVKATSQATGAVREATTDDSGHYVIALLPVSMYTIRVEFKGFQTTEAKDLRLQVDEQRELDFALAPASVNTSVEVVANEVAVETANPTLGQVITSQQVAQLPLNGRDFVQLATLTPGTTAETNPNSFFTSAASSEVAARGPFSLSVGGSRPNSTDWLIDGVDNNELTAGGISILSSIDSIQEFKVLTYNYSAEYGTRAGPTVLLTTKSGTNDFHGSLFEFLRNTSLDAKSFFANSTEKFNLNQFGGAIGGPIHKNKTFFFVDGEQKYQRHGIPFTGLVPTDAMRNGDYSADNFGNPVSGLVIVNPNMIGAASANPAAAQNIYFQCDGSGNPLPVNADGSQARGTNCNKIPGANPLNAASLPNGLLNPIGQAMMNLYPSPNANNANAGINFVSQPVRKLDETKFDIRVDHNFSSADSLFARFSYDQASSFVPGGSTGFAEANAFGSNQGIVNHARNIAVGETHIFSPTTVNQLSFGYNRIFDYITSQGTGSCESAKLGIIGANLGCDSGGTTCTPGAFSCGLVSTLMTGGYWSLGDRGFTPFQGGTNIFSVKDSLDIIRGKHDIKVGIDVRANQMNVGTEAFQDGFWIPGAIGNFSGFASSDSSIASVQGNPTADFLMGLVGVAEHDQTFNGPVTGRRWKIYRPFVQDDWRISKDLTLNLGLAWDITNPIREVDGRMANYDPFVNQQFIAGQNGVTQSAGVQKNWTAFEPRIGLAWKVLGSDKTVFRAGYAIYHDSAWSMGAQGLWQNPPFFAESDAFGAAQQVGAPGCPFATSFCAATVPVTGVNISDGFQIFNTPPDLATFTGTLYFQPRNFKLAKVQQFNVNLERQIPGNVVLTVGYAGSRGNHILVAGNNLNTSTGTLNCSVGTIGCNPDGTPFSPGFAVGNAVLGFVDVGKTTYDSLQVKAETKASRYGLYALIGYTYSHTYDNGLSDGLGSLVSAPFFPLPNWSKLDWAPSQIDLRNSFTASVIYDLPFGKGKKFGNDWNNVANSVLGGWQLTVIEKITSGFADPLIDSSNQSGVTFNAGGNANNFNRPDQIADPYKAGPVAANPDPKCQQLISQGGKAPDQLSNSGFPINPCAFTQAIGHLGNASRLPVYGPGFVNTDFSVIKQFALPWENMGLNFRAEFFNLFNHAQFGEPVSDVSAPGFGSVQSTVNNPRVVQFGLKLTF